MADSIQVAVFENGELKRPATGEATKEVVLALPLGRLLVKPFKIPAESSQDDPAAAISATLQSMSPYPDEPLTVGMETLREDVAGKIVLAAALPESAADDIGEALDAAKVNPVKIDARILGALRERWGEIVKTGEDKRRIVALREDSATSLAVLDGEIPVALRSVADGEDMRRAIVLALIEAEDFAGERELAEAVALGSLDAAVPETAQDGADGAEGAARPVALPAPGAWLEELGKFASVREVPCADDVGFAGVAERALDQATLNALPESWRQMLLETRFKAKLVKSLAIAGGIWLAIIIVLFGVPVVYGFMTDHQKALMKEHSRKYQEVREMREKVRLVQKYSDHSRGALEILKAVSDRLPEGVELTSWSFKRDEGARFSGEAVAAPAVYQLKNDLLEMKEDGEDGARIFADVRLTGPTKAKGKERFDIECLYEKNEE